MSNNQYCRYRVKAVVDGNTQINGFFTCNSAQIALNSLLGALGAPTLDCSNFMRYAEGALITCTMMLNDTLLAYEVECIANPDGSRKSQDALPPLPSTK
jgi:hypothetical protein